jgi:hypothetical protein
MFPQCLMLSPTVLNVSPLSAEPTVSTTLVIVGKPVLISILNTPTDSFVSVSTTFSAVTPSVPRTGVTAYIPPSFNVALPLLGNTSPRVLLIKLSVSLS